MSQTPLASRACLDNYRRHARAQLNGSSPPDSSFLADATPALLEQAVAWNHCALFGLGALAAGGEVRQKEGLLWTWGDGDGTILFPQLADADAGPLLDEVVACYRERRPEGLVGCWSLDPPQPADLEVRLLARGFQLGWQPRWMWLDLERIHEDHQQPEGLQVALCDDDSDWDAPDLPYYHAKMPALRAATATQTPRRLWHFGAWLEGRAVGHSVLCVTTGSLGVGGLYHIGVVPDARKRGIGKAVTLAACRKARELGCRYVLLNATGERMYRQVGFRPLGWGRTWWLNVPRLEARPPTPERVAVAEAVGRGDRDALGQFAGATIDWDEALPNGMTLLDLAVHARQPAVAEWLIRQGATLDVVSAWDLGWRDRIPRLLATDPSLANRQTGEMNLSPLHIAAERDDPELAQTVLAAGPDLTVQDSLYHSTPLGWARHLGRKKIAVLIERHQAAGAQEGHQP